MSLKVAIIGPPLAFLFGGQEVQADALHTRWQNDAEVTATFLASRPALPKPLAAINRVPGLRTVVRFPFYLVNLFRTIGGVELVHAFAGSFGTFLVATAPIFAVARLRGRKILVHYHSGQGKEHIEGSPLARYILRACDAVVVPSECLAASFLPQRVSSMVVPNVVDPDRFPYRPREPLQPRLLCTRNFDARYGLDIVVRAFAKVQREFPEASLCLAGTGPQAPEIRGLVEELALNHVHFMGAVHPHDMPAIYNQSDIFVNGSHIDCAPVSILEAFCSGLPVVTTAVGGIPYLVEHERTGLLCPPGSPLALAESVIHLIRHPYLVRPMTDKALKQINAHSWSSLRPLWLRAYRAALG